MLRHMCTQFWNPASDIFRLSQTLSKLKIYDTTYLRNYHGASIYDEDDDDNSYSKQKYPERQNSNYGHKRYFNPDSNNRNFRFKNNYQNRQRNFFQNENSFSENRSMGNFNDSFGKLTKPTFKPEDMQEILKYFYVEHPDVASRSEEEVKAYRERLSISVQGLDIPKPITSFDELCLPDNLKKVVIQQGYEEPTPIQAQGWSIALSGRDMVGISQTGSGKTLVFILPAIIHAINQPATEVQNYECKPKVLVLAPTRELVQQILQVSERFSGSCRMKTACAYGGASKNYQLHSLRGADICIATPGRLIDFVSSGLVNLQQCTYLVLDEADRMLDMGFEPQIRQIIDQIRPDRQTLMWSATWPRDIQNLAEDFLNNYVKVTVGAGELVANPNIQQNIYVVEEREKEDRLEHLLRELTGEEDCKILIFAQTKRKVDYLGMLLNEIGFSALCIHGDVSQTRRDKVLQSFRRRKSCILIATDVAARGLDITDIQHVVNYDLSTNVEDYIHRIGRTARGNSSGEAHSFFTRENVGIAKELVEVLQQANQSVPPELLSIIERRPYRKRQKSTVYQQWRNQQDQQYSY